MGNPTTRLIIIRNLAMVALLIGLDRGMHYSRAEEAGVKSPINAETHYREPDLAPADKEHWAFQPLGFPAIPRQKSSNQDGVINTAIKDSVLPKVSAIDAFLTEQLRNQGLHFQPVAEPATLLRRVSLVLTGLPPTVAEQTNFFSDPSPHAYEKVVDRLLASPGYGERWGQPWLDLARFAETDGFEFDHVRPEAWRYRDWVIAALNRDLRYDQFLTLQLAGDEQGDPVATGFALAGADMPDLNSQDERRHMILNEMTATVGSVFLGLTMGCAQCHDHKYDPISMADFYRLRASFDNIELFKTRPEGRVLFEPNGNPRVSYILARGDFRRPGAVIQAGFPRVFDPRGMVSELPQAFSNATRRRSALAAWLTDAGHPLVARVIVNRAWQQVFGKGLVPTPSDFGLMGEVPTHPQLLEWLARDFITQGWSLKKLHRQLVLTRAFQQSGVPMDELTWRKSREKDANNRNLSRWERRRLEGETIRDSLLVAAGLLQRRQGGPGVMAALPPELMATLLKGQWTEHGDPREHQRRAIYLFARRNLRYPLFEVFDRPDALTSCPQRGRSISAPQALLMLNAREVHAAAAALADDLLNKTNDNKNRLQLAFQRVLARFPSNRESSILNEFLDKRRDEKTRAANSLREKKDTLVTERAAWTDICLALFNANEFVFLE